MTDYYAVAEALEREVAGYLEAGEINKPDYDSLKRNVDHAVDKLSEVIAAEHLYGKGGAIYDIGRNHADHKHWQALVWAVHVSYARDVLTLGKKLAKVKTDEFKAHALFKDVAAFYERYKGLAEQTVALKDKVVSTSQRRTEKKDAARQERELKFTQYATLVAVLQAHMDAYVARAGKLADDTFELWMDGLSAADWNIDKAAPKPDRRKVLDEIADYMDAKRARLLSVTDAASNKDEVTRKRSPEKKAHYVATQKRAAREAYMAWIYKMIQKIGKPVTEATMTGDPWVGSTLTVVRNDKVKQVWHTQMIVNRSKYDLLFNQFPSRQVA